MRGLLVERETEIMAIASCLSAARQGDGSTVVLEGPAGQGKSSLLTVAADMGRDAGGRILGASGVELEHDFPFGLVIQLFEPRLMSTEPDEWEELLAGPADLARGLLEPDRSSTAQSPDEREYSLIHGLFWLTCNLVTEASAKLHGGPVVIVVDDVQWGDRSSLRFLNYLAQRLGNLPVLLVIAVRPGETSSDPQALSALCSAPTATRLPLASLTDAGVEALVRAQFHDAQTDFVTACAQLTSGNPFLLGELLAQVLSDRQPPDAQTAGRLRKLAPAAIVNSVLTRLATMPAAERALATALSVLGDGAPLSRAARLAELDIETAASAADALAAIHMFDPGVPLSFVHPVVRSAVTASMSPLALGQAHRLASVILREDGAGPEVVAAHLLAAPPESEPEAVESLRAAARIALARGAASSAAQLLERALAERPVPAVHPDLLAELAHAEAVAGLPNATQRLTEAMRVTECPAQRAKLALAHGRVLYSQGRYREAASVLNAALADPPLDDELTREVEALYICATSLVLEMADEAAPRRRRLLDGLAEHLSTSERLAVAHIAVHDSVSGEPRAGVRRLADLAWGDGVLLENEADDHFGWQFLTAALLFADELERAVELCDAALALADTRESPLLHATATYCRAWLLYEQGQIDRAAVDTVAAIDARPHGGRSYYRTHHGGLACCHLQRGELEQAEAALATIDALALKETIQYPFLLDVRAQLRLAQHRPREALTDALTAGRQLQTDFGPANPGAVAWRSTAALAHLALGEPGRAEALASDELDQARRIGVTRVVMRDLRILGLIAGGAAGLALLAEAVEVGEHYPPRLEYVNALVDFGAAVRRANHRAAAREPLRKALELSHLGGATVLAERAQIELEATGARPRRVMLSGLDSLTPSERRVAEHAANGLTTRQIADTLFVSPKTVEFHLRHTYRKLDISSRTELSAALSGDPD